MDLNALAWLEDYLQTWPSTLFVVSHDRSFLNAVATDIIHQHAERLDYYKGNFAQFYATKSERAKQQRREYESQLQYRQHLQAFIDRWRCASSPPSCVSLASRRRADCRPAPHPTPSPPSDNANRAAQAQSKIKILEKLPELTPPEEDDIVTFKFPETDKISPPLLQLADVDFGYHKDRMLLKGVNIDVGLDSRIGLIGANGAGKSTLCVLGAKPPCGFLTSPLNDGPADVLPRCSGRQAQAPHWRAAARAGSADAQRSPPHRMCVVAPPPCLFSPATRGPNRIARPADPVLPLAVRCGQTLRSTTSTRST